jgi:hypothetical protein
VAKGSIELTVVAAAAASTAAAGSRGLVFHFIEDWVGTFVCQGDFAACATHAPQRGVFIP